MKIDFGCGEKPKEGFCGCDIRKFSSIKYVCNSWEIGQYVGETAVDEVYSRHFIEHLTFFQFELTLRAWWTILRSRGRLTIITPNLRWHCEQFINNREEYSKERGGNETGLYGWQRETEAGHDWDVHKSGYDFRSLHNYLILHGFTDITQLKGTTADNSNHPKHLHVVALKDL